MKLNAPKQVTWLIAVIIGVLGLLLSWDVITIKEFFKHQDLWLTTVGFGLLTLGTLLKGL
jgi:hypothetical protein